MRVEKATGLEIQGSSISSGCVFQTKRVGGASKYPKTSQEEASGKAYSLLQLDRLGLEVQRVVLRLLHVVVLVGVVQLPQGGLELRERRRLVGEVLHHLDDELRARKPSSGSAEGAAKGRERLHLRRSSGRCSPDSSPPSSPSWTR